MVVDSSGTGSGRRGDGGPWRNSELLCGYPISYTCILPFTYINLHAIEVAD